RSTRAGAVGLAEPFAKLFGKLELHDPRAQVEPDRLGKVAVVACSPIDTQLSLVGGSLVNQRALAAIGREVPLARALARIERRAAFGKRTEGRRNCFDCRLLLDVAD